MNEGETNVPEDAVERPRTPERRCAYPGCTTRLSIYNADFLCWAHADARTRARFDNLHNRERGLVRLDRAEPTDSLLSTR